MLSLGYSFVLNPDTTNFFVISDVKQRRCRMKCDVHGCDPEDYKGRLSRIPEFSVQQARRHEEYPHDDGDDHCKVTES